MPALSNCKDTGEEPSSLHNRKHTKHTHTTWVQNTTLYSDDTTCIKQHRSKGVQPNGSPCANNHCSTRYDQSFRHSKHTHTNQKLLQTKIPGAIIKFIANYIKGCKVYTTYRNHTYSQREFKTGVPQDGVLSPTIFNNYTADIPPPRAPIHNVAYASHLHTQARVQPRKTYNHTNIKLIALTK